MMNTTTASSFADRLAAYRAKNAAAAAAVRYASYNLYRVNDNSTATLAGVLEFPNDTRNANFGGVCFYDAATDSFRDSTEVSVGGTAYFLERTA